MAVSGASAMVYQVAWGRTLSMVYGSSVYGVAIMLSTFLFGITAGSILASWWLARRAPRDPWLRVAQLLMGSAVLAFVSLIISRSLPFLFLNFYTSVDGNDGTLFRVSVRHFCSADAAFDDGTGRHVALSPSMPYPRQPHSAPRLHDSTAGT